MNLIVGKSNLATEIAKTLPNVVIVGRPEYDLSSQESCDELLSQYTPNLVINTQALNESHNSWDILTVNYVSVVYLTLGFYEKMNSGHIINISSTSTYWVSYPEITLGRLCYNISKESLSAFGRHINRATVDRLQKPTISTIELGKFNSKFNGFSGGMTLSKAANIVKSCILEPVASVSVIR
jgi:NAD(P)-dependent dehydrogenase (short-subunit alcohol dehydrogenase family)